jgi:hypothetical protein
MPARLFVISDGADRRHHSIASAYVILLIFTKIYVRPKE